MEHPSTPPPLSTLLEPSTGKLESELVQGQQLDILTAQRKAEKYKTLYQVSNTQHACALASLEEERRQCDLRVQLASTEAKLAEMQDLKSSLDDERQRRHRLEIQLGSAEVQLAITCEQRRYAQGAQFQLQDQLKQHREMHLQLAATTIERDTANQKVAVYQERLQESQTIFHEVLRESNATVQEMLQEYHSNVEECLRESRPDDLQLLRFAQRNMQALISLHHKLESAMLRFTCVGAGFALHEEARLLHASVLPLDKKENSVSSSVEDTSAEVTDAVHQKTQDRHYN